MTHTRAARRLFILITSLTLAGCVVVPVPVVLSSHSTPGIAAKVDLGPVPASSYCAAPRRLSASQNDILALVNAERKAHGLGRVTASSTLNSVAQKHACDNAARELYSHYGSDGSDLKTRLKRGGYRLKVAVENTGRGFDAADRVVTFWMHSPGHRTNILRKDVTELGLGLADGARPAWVLVLAERRR